MSNVLIGIIGVILFIGLALAGALILGDDFGSASSQSKATVVVSMLQQTASGLEMYSVKTGRTVPEFMQINGNPDLIPRFVKQNWTDPTTGRSAVVRIFGEGMYVTVSGQSEAICKSINETMSGSATVPRLDFSEETPTPAGAGGCFEANASGNRFAYLRIGNS